MVPFSSTGGLVEQGGSLKVDENVRINVLGHGSDLEQAIPHLSGVYE